MGYDIRITFTLWVIFLINDLLCESVSSIIVFNGKIIFPFDPKRQEIVRNATTENAPPIEELLKEAVVRAKLVRSQCVSNLISFIVKTDSFHSYARIHRVIEAHIDETQPYKRIVKEKVMKSAVIIPNIAPVSTFMDK